MSNSDIFPIFNPLNEEFLFYKSRVLVHREGDWHRGIQANIIRETNNHSFEILVQERSNVVDIAKHKYDQSLATQMTQIDNFDEVETLRRGLLTELGVKEFDYLKIPEKMRIIKTYKEHPDMLNKELISLFIVKVNRNQQVKKASKKVKNIFWMEWQEFLKFYKKNTSQFTKTAQFYFSNGAILKQIDAYSHFLIFKHSGESGNKITLHVNKYRNKTATYRCDFPNLDIMLQHE